MFCRRITLNVVWVFYVAMTISFWTIPVTSVSDQHFSAINLGYVFQHKGSVKIVDHVVKLAFTIDIPLIAEPSNITEMSCGQLEAHINGSGRQIHSERNQTLKVPCTRINSLVTFLHDLQASLHRNIYEQMNDIRNILTDIDTLPESSRSKRSWFPFLGKLLHTVTGVETEGHFRSMRGTLNELKRLTAESAQVFHKDKDSFMTAIKAESRRISNVLEITAMERKDITNLYEQVYSLYQQERNEVSVITSAFRQLTKYTQMSNNLQAFRSEIDMLLAGKLSPELISYESLDTALKNLASHLQTDRRLHIMFRNHAWYFQNAKFMVVRQNSTLIVLIDCPLTEHIQNLHYLEFRKFPMHIRPTSESHFSELAVDFHGALYHHAVPRYFVLQQPLQNHDQPLEIGTLPMPLSQSRNMTCVLGLLTPNLNAIRSLCQYHITERVITPEVIKLPNHHFLLINISQWVTTCGNTVDSMVVTNTHLAVPLRCHCAAMADNFVIPTRKEGCEHPPPTRRINVRIQPKFLVNLALLYEFFDEETLRSFRHNTLLDVDLNLTLPQLTINSKKEYDARMAVETTQRHLLEQTINHTKNNEKIYISLAHFIYDQLLEIQSKEDYTGFNIFSVSSWVLVATTILSVVLLLAVVGLYKRYRMLAFLLSVRAAPVTAMTIPTALHFGGSRTSPTPSSAIPISSLAPETAFLLTNLYWLLTVFILLTFVCSLVTVFYYRRRKHQRFPTKLYLEIGNEHEKITILYTRLQEESKFLEFRVSSLNASLILSYHYCLPYLNLNFVDVTLSHSYLHLLCLLSTKVRVCPCEATRIKRILVSEYFIALKVKDCRERLASELVVLRNPFGPSAPMLDNDKSITDKLNSAHIYPRLPSNEDQTA